MRRPGHRHSDGRNPLRQQHRLPERLPRLDRPMGLGEGSGRGGRPRWGVLGVSSRPWLAVTAMRRPGREGLVKHRAQVRDELPTSVTLPHETDPPHRSSSQFAVLRTGNCERTGSGHGEGGEGREVSPLP